MVIDRGFSVNNYVGTYKMTYIPDKDDIFIMSKEYKNARQDKDKVEDEDEVEVEIKSKTLFTFDEKHYKYICTEFANINLDHDESILNFCNLYGLPFSSLKILDIQECFTIFNLEVPEEIYETYDPYYRQDNMPRSEFCEHVMFMRNMFILKGHVEQVISNSYKSCLTDWNELLEAFLSLLLTNPYEYYLLRDETPAASSSLRFHDYFTSFRKSFDKMDNDSSIENIIKFFLKDYDELCKNPEKINNTYSYDEDYKSQHWNDLKDLLEQLFKNNLFLNFTSTLYGNVKFDLVHVLSEPVQKQLTTLSTQLLCDLANEFLSRIHPSLSFDKDNQISSNWVINSQFEGMILEFFFLISRKTIFRKCANPTCGNYFSTLTGSPTKKYCCHSCALLEAKRRERKKKKLMKMQNKDLDNNTK